MKIYDPTGIGDHSRFWLSCLGSLVLVLPKLIIICLSYLSIFIIPDEGFSRNASCTLNLIFTFFFFIKSGSNYIYIIHILTKPKEK